MLSNADTTVRLRRGVGRWEQALLQAAGAQVHAALDARQRQQRGERRPGAGEQRPPEACTNLTNVNTPSVNKVGNTASANAAN